MDDDVKIGRISHGHTRAARLEHGAIIEFEALPAEWVDGHMIDVHFPDGSTTILHGEPEYGPTTVSWRRDPHSTWHIRLEPVGPNSVRVELEEYHREIISLGA